MVHDLDASGILHPSMCEDEDADSGGYTVDSASYFTTNKSHYQEPEEWNCCDDLDSGDETVLDGMRADTTEYEKYRAESERGLNDGSRLCRTPFRKFGWRHGDFKLPDFHVNLDFLNNSLVIIMLHKLRRLNVRLLQRIAYGGPNALHRMIENMFGDRAQYWMRLEMAKVDGDLDKIDGGKLRITIDDFRGFFPFGVLPASAREV